MKIIIYIFSTQVLTQLTSFVVHSGVLIAVEGSLERTQAILPYLPGWFVASIFMVGLVSGVILGFYWWNVVYVQRRHWSFKLTH